MSERNTCELLCSIPMTIKDKIDDEGIQARNLIKFNVPMRDKKKSEIRPHSLNLKTENESICQTLTEGVVCPQECGDVLSLNNRVPLMITTDSIDSSQSVFNKTGDYRARYWGQMIDTLKRTIDEIYSACENDESEVECKEVIMILEKSKKDFYSLIEKMILFKEIENSTTENRPAYIAWDERKISPGKPIMRQILEQTKRTHSHSGQSSSTMSQTELPSTCKETVAINDIVQSNTFPDCKSDESTRNNSESSACTWADKLKSQKPFQKNGNMENVSSKLSDKSIKLKEKVVKKIASKSCQIKSNTVSKKARPPKNDNKVDGEWEIVCRTKFSQRIKSYGLDRNSSGKTLSDRPTRKSLSNKSKNQYFKRNKSKSEACLPQKHIDDNVSSTSNRTDNSSIVMKSSSSISGQHFMEFHGRNTNAMIDSKHSTFIYSRSAARKKSISSQRQSTRSCMEISQGTSKCDESMTTSCKSEDDKLNLGGAKDQNTIDMSFISSTENDTLNTSIDNSTDEFGDDDETTHNIRQLDKKLADVENVETELQNELGRAQEEEKACREQMEKEEQNACLEKIEQVETSVSQSLEITANECSAIQDDNDDGYDFVLNVSFEKSNSMFTSANFTSLPTNKSLLPIEEIKRSMASHVTIDWSQIDDEIDIDNEWEDSVAKLRTPGRGVEMHQKLSAPSRRRSINSMQQLEEKQTKAKVLREKLLLDRTEKVRELTKKVEEVRQHKCELLEEKKVWMGQRLQKAEIKRQQQLDERVKKAHDEEIKGKEIAFIQSLEAAQKQFTILTKHQESEARLLERQEERKKRMEEKAEREVAAETRRKKIEISRQAWLNELQQRWKTRDEELASKAECKERQRRDAMRAKEVERELKKTVLEQQQKTHIEQLKEKIFKKHEDSERRHHEQLAEISRKAFEMSVAKYSLEEAADAPPIETYVNKKWCNVCFVMIDSDVLLQSHLSGKKHKTCVKELLSGDHIEKDQIKKFNLEHIVDAPEDKTDPKVQAKTERRKVVKKRIKRIKQRMMSQTPEFEKLVDQLHKNVSHTANKQKFLKFINDIRRYMGIKDSGPWVQSRVTSLEKVLVELDRCIDVKKTESTQPLVVTQSEQQSFLALGGLRMLSTVIELIHAQKSENSPILPEKTFKLVFKCVQKLCSSNNNVSHYIIYSNFIAHLMDGLQTKLCFLIPENFSIYLKNCTQPERELPTNVVVEQILVTLTGVFDNFMITNSSESIYGINCRLPGDNSGRSSSQSNASSRIDSVMVEYQKIQDIVSYAVSTGTIDKLSDYLSQVRGPLKEGSGTANFVLIILSFLSSLLKLLSSTSPKPNMVLSKVQFESSRGGDTDSGSGDFFKAFSDRTQLLSTIEDTEMCGLVCLLYGLLLYQGNSDVAGDNLSALTCKITIAGLKLINNFAMLNLSIMQSVLSQEGTSLQLRHILSYLLFYCNERLNGVFKFPFNNKPNGDATKTDTTSFNVPKLLHEVILCIGYFCVNNTENQNFVQTGQRPSILQQLCQLPFAYFSQNNLVQCLFPTLISCCFNNNENTAIIEMEMTCGLLSSFIEEKMVEIETSEGLNKSSTNYDERFAFHSRFPTSCWGRAKHYFER